MNGSVTIAIAIVGTMAAAFGLGCLIVGLLDKWREWTNTHMDWAKSHIGARDQ